MKILEQTETQLKLQAKPSTPWFFASAQLVAGLLFAYIGLGNRVDCQRVTPEQINCNWRTTSTEIESQSVQGVRSIRVEEYQFEEGMWVPQVFLIHESGETLVHGEVKDAEKVQHFLNDSTKQRLFFFHNKLPLVLSAVLLGLCALNFVVARTVVVHFDKKSDRVQVSSRSLLRKEAIQFELSSISEIKVEAINNVLTARRKYELLGILVRFKEGDRELSLVPENTDRAKVEQITAILRDFLALSS